jgi:precorrin-2 dehydrogenase/sirohydrochlorin ferrochelatase
MFYPVYLNLKGRRVVVIGGGNVAERKIESLLESGAFVLVVSPEVTPRIACLSEQKKVEIQYRSYVQGDCSGASLVFSATGDPEINRAVYQEATALGVFINSADQPDRCSFIMPAVVRRGNIGVAISTNGTSPALAARLRRKISEVIGPEYARLAELLARIRPEIRSKVHTDEQRKDLHYRIIDSEIVSLLKVDDRAPAERRLKEIIEDFVCETSENKTS